MKEILNTDTIQAFNTFHKIETRNSLVSLVKGSAFTIQNNLKSSSLYYITFNYHKEQQGNLSIVFPEQGGGQSRAPYKSIKYTLVFHSDLMLGTSLADTIGNWDFSHYPTDTAILLPSDGCRLIADCFESIEQELEYAIDKHSKKLIASHIERLLNYCQRFYDHQVVPDEAKSHGILKRLDDLLNEYISSGNIYEIGIPMVSYFADRLHRSRNYFGDLVRKETGRSAQEYIHERIVEEAKTKISHKNKSINEIAFELGFKYPQHFSRFFKKRVGQSPNEFRLANSSEGMR